MERFDVLVIGGGNAGCAAALAAARHGARTLLVERYGFLGGTATAAMVGPWMTFHSGTERIVGGIAQEIVERLVARGGSPGHIADASDYVATITPFDPELHKALLFEMMCENGVQLLVHAYFLDALTETEASGVNGGRVSTGVYTRAGKAGADRVQTAAGAHIAPAGGALIAAAGAAGVAATGNGHVTTVCGARVATVGGMREYEATVTIDASADAYVAASAGVDVQQGDERGRVQPASLMFRLSHVDLAETARYLRENADQMRTSLPPEARDASALTAVAGLRALWNRARERGDVDIPRELVSFFGSSGSRVGRI